MGRLTAKTLREAEREYPGDAFYAAIATTSEDEYWQKIVDSGWLEGMPEREAGRIHAELHQTFLASPEAAMECLTALSIDQTAFAESYSAVLERLREASWGTFAPGNLSETEADDGSTVLSFTHMGRVYSARLSSARVDDQKILKLANRALRDAGAERQFAILCRGVLKDDHIRLVFASERAFYKAEDLGVFPANDANAFFR
jgi:hypothetical protein